jgi:hypothetical protein
MAGHGVHRPIEAPTAWHVGVSIGSPLSGYTAALGHLILSVCPKAVLGSHQDGCVTLADQTPRARRYPVTFAIEYRHTRHQEWRSGVTRNVSASGVLFVEASSDRPLALDEAVDMRLMIPSNIAGQPATCVICSGHIARIVHEGSFDQPRTVAATIRRYRLLRTDPASSPAAHGRADIH